MADIDLQALGMRLGEAITPTPSNAPQVRYATVATVNADGTLDVTVDGTTLRGVCATTGCVGAAAGMRCVVLRQGPLATVVGLIAGRDLGSVYLQNNEAIYGADADGDYMALIYSNADNTNVGYGGYNAQQGRTNVYGNEVRIHSRGNVDIRGSVTYDGATPYKEVNDTTGKSLANNTFTALASLTLEAGVWVVVGTAQFASNATGHRGINIAGTSGSTSTNAAAAAQVQAANGTQTVVTKTSLIRLTATTTYYLNARQNSGSALTTYSNLRAVRVA